MRKELVEIGEIDRYIFCQMQPKERLVFFAQMLINKRLAQEVKKQQRVHKLLRFLFRMEQHNKLEEIYNHLLNDREFSRELKNIFQ